MSSHTIEVDTPRGYHTPRSSSSSSSKATSPRAVHVVDYVPPRYISYLCCWDKCRCQKDCGLCLYAQFCSLCLYGEIMERLETPTLCCPLGAVPSCLCASSAAIASLVAGLVACAVCGLPLSNLGCAACVTCTSRLALQYHYGLPTEDCAHPCLAHYFCLSCALYQEALFVKHVLRRDFRCCCYARCSGSADDGLGDEAAELPERRHRLGSSRSAPRPPCCCACCACCACETPGPGHFREPLVAIPGAVVIAQQPVAAAAAAPSSSSSSPSRRGASSPRATTPTTTPRGSSSPRQV